MNKEKVFSENDYEKKIELLKELNKTFLVEEFRSYELGNMTREEIDLIIGVYQSKLDGIKKSINTLDYVKGYLDEMV